MNRRTQLYILGGLLGVLALLIFSQWGGGQVAQVFFRDEKFQPLKVENPSLRLDLLEKISKLEYAGAHHNIFDRKEPPPPPVKQAPAPPPVDPGPALPPPEPPLVLPYKFFGYSVDAATGRRRAFFTAGSGDDVWILAEGETLQNRFRLLRIGTNTVELEEIASGKRAQLRLEEQPAS
jgi:hypothetical protein